jgi:TetR/AcrR family transcriptional regulator
MADPTAAAPGAKDRILEAAARLFAAHGYAATSVAQIADAADANRALLYYYFKDKRDLYWAIMERGLELVIDLIGRASRAPGTPWERLQWFVQQYYELLMSHSDVARMILREMSGIGEHPRLPVERHLRQVIAGMRAIIADGLEHGDLQGVDAELATFSLFGMIHVFFTQRLATGRDFPTSVVVAHTLRLFGDGARAGAASRRDQAQTGRSRRRSR